MNLFLLSLSATEAVVSMCDQHVVKMILESAQVLYCAWHTMAKEALLKFVDDYNALRDEGMALKPYKATHRLHPISIWVRAHSYHYQWACEYALVMCKEYTLRYGKTHKTEEHLLFLSHIGYPIASKDYHPESPKKQTKEWVYATRGIPEMFYYFPLCMPEEYYVKDEDGEYDAVMSYRYFYANKSFDMRYRRNTLPPLWLKKLRRAQHS